jgi:hypothetical protein
MRALSGTIRVRPIAKIYDMDEIAIAHNDMEHNRVAGKFGGSRPDAETDPPTSIRP